MKSYIQNFFPTLRIPHFAFLIIFLTNCWTNPFWKPILFPQIKADNKWMLLIPLAFQGKATPSNQTTTVTVTGTVTNASGTALGNHTLTFQPTGTTTTTDASGNFTVSLPPGTYTATVTDSAETVVGTFTLTVVDGGTTSVGIDTGRIIVTANGVTGLPDTVATPVFTPAAGTYSTDQSVTITTATSGATIYYTVDGSTPTTSSIQYISPISVAGNGTTKTIKAIAGKSGLSNSPIVSGTWTISSTSSITYSISGTISGLTANGLVLQNNGGNNLSKGSGSTSFIFSTSLNSGAAYSVTVVSQPTGLGCTVTNGSGTATANVTNVAVTCFTSTPETYTWGTFTDNYDGTVKFVGVAGTFGGNAYTAQTLIWMKCSQGQTWNSVTNSCDGTAGTFQYCSNNACNSTVTWLLNGTGNSPAYNTCDTLTFVGQTDWRVPTKNELKVLIHCTNKIMPNDSINQSSPHYCDAGFIAPTLNNLFPSSVANYYWSSSTSFEYNTGYAWSVNFNFGNTEHVNKPLNSCIRCVR